MDPLSGRDLAAFVATVDAGSVNGAAERLSLTQSAVSKRLQSLERRTGMPLLETGRFGARPTAAGRLLYPEAKRALSALAHAARVVGDAGGRGAPVLHVAASHTIGEFLVPGWLARFRAAEPSLDLRVEVDVLNSPGVLRSVRAGTASLGFVEGVDDLDDFDARMLMHDELLVLVAAGHPWLRAGRIGPGELGGGDYMARERDSGTRAVVSSVLTAHGVVLEPTLETSSIHALKQAVMGGGFTILSRVAADQELRTGALREVEVSTLSFERRLQVVRRRGGDADPMAERLWAWLADEVRSGSIPITSRS